MESADAPSILRPYGFVFICVTSLFLFPSDSRFAYTVRVAADRRLFPDFWCFTNTNISVQGCTNPFIQRFTADTYIIDPRVF